VDPDWHRQGIGGALMRHAVTMASAAGLHRVMVESDPHAETFYRRLGGRRVGDTPAPMPGAVDRVLPVLEFTVDPTG
jgi:predicted N-acetyltransferase YhbS